MKRVRKKFTPEEDGLLVAMNKEKYTIKEITEEFKKRGYDRKRTSIYSRHTSLDLPKYFIPVPREPSEPAQDSKVKAKRKQRRKATKAKVEEKPSVAQPTPSGYAATAFTLFNRIEELRVFTETSLLKLSSAIDKMRSETTISALAKEIESVTNELLNVKVELTAIKKVQADQKAFGSAFKQAALMRDFKEWLETLKLCEERIFPNKP